MARRRGGSGSDRSARYHRERIVLLNTSGGASMANDEHVAMLKTARPANARDELIRSRTVRSWRPRIRLCGRFGDRPGVHVACISPLSACIGLRGGFCTQLQAVPPPVFFYQSGGVCGPYGARAAWMKAASGRRIDRARHIALPACGIGERHGGEQRPRIGVLASAVKLSGGGDLDDLAEIHHRTPRKKRRRSTDIRFMATAFRGMKLRYGPDQTDPYGRSPPGLPLAPIPFHRNAL